MDLRNGRIMVGGLLSHPAARALLEREFPLVREPCIRRRVWNLPLSRVLQLAPRYLPQSRLDALLRQLRAL